MPPKKTPELAVVSNDPVEIDDKEATEEVPLGKTTDKEEQKTEEKTGDKTEDKNKSKEKANDDSKTKETKDESKSKEDVKGDSKAKDDSKSKNDSKSKDDSKSKNDSKSKDETTEDAPQQPPRPVSPITRITNDLKDAFPNADEKTIYAVLIASQGQVDPAFNALLYLSDPQFKPEITIQTPASRPAGVEDKNAIPDDELLARKLQKEFELEDQRRRERRRQRREQRRSEEEQNDSPDEFEQLKETFTQGLEDARSTLNGWVSGLAKKFDGNEDTPQNQEAGGKKLFGALGGSSFNNNTSRQSKFDEDPKIINQYEFNNKISLKDEDKDLPKLPQRKKETEGAPPGKKWQPLNSDVPANSDAFLVTDSEEEDAK